MTTLSQTRSKKKQPSSTSNWIYLNITIRVVQSLLRIAISLLILGGALGAGIGLGYFAYLVQDTPAPTKDELQHELGDVSETSTLTYADNQAIAPIRSDLLRNSIPSNQISDWLKKAIVATEDEYFYQHHGVVPKAVLRALVSEVTGIGSSGGSTLTQQLVKQQILTDETTFSRKANEILLAMEVEDNFSKDEIVTLYLNVSPFGRNNQGQNIAGVQEAAQGIFGVDAKDLNLPQAAFIAGLPQSPIVYSPYTNTGEIKKDLHSGLDRKNFVLFSMYRNHDITKKEYTEALAYDLTADFKPQEEANKKTFNYLYDAVLDEAEKIVAKQLADQDELTAEEFASEENQEKYLDRAATLLANGGYTVQSTVDKDIYQAMQQTVSDYGYLLDDGISNIEVGNVLMENTTGKILGFVGGRDYSSNQYNHAFSSYRQAGSAIKPTLVYASAIDQGLMGSESRVSDYPTNWQNGSDAGGPVVNAGNFGSRTFQTVREALIYSTNIPAYHIYQNTLNSMGSTSAVYDTYLSKMNYPNSETWQYESAPLGVSELTTLQQTNGFQTLANNGIYEQGYLVESIKDHKGNVLYQHKDKPVEVYSRATASIMTNLLRSVIDVGATSSFKSAVGNLNWELTNADWVGKTGTTDNDVDSWLVVATPTITLSSWSGREDSQPPSPGSGQRTANYMSQLANAIYQANPDVIGIDKRFTLDDSVKVEKVNPLTGTQPGGQMTVNNYTFTLSNNAVDSYWATDGPKPISYQFGIGGTDADYADYWQKLMPKPKPPKPKPTPPKPDKKKDDKKDEDKNKDKDDKKDTKKENKKDN